MTTNLFRCVSVSLAVCGLALGTAHAQKSKEYKFTNDTGKDAQDLHIDFNHGVTWTGTVPEQSPKETFKEAETKGSSKVGLAAGQSGSGVKAGDSVSITFEYDGTTPKVKNSKWTYDNKTCLTANSSFQDMVCMEALVMFDGGPATGNGMLMVVIDNQPHPFQTLPGDPPWVTAEKFASLVSNIPWGDVSEVGPQHVRFTGLSYFSQKPNVIVEMVQPDFTQLINVMPVKPLPCPGDVDGDGTVSQKDLGVLLAAYGTQCGEPGYIAAADLDDDGHVGQGDLGILLGNYGLVCPE